MPIKVSISLALLLVSMTGMVLAENHADPDDLWTTYTSDNGLGLNRTRDVNADPRGGVWVGTQGGGVSYFNGSSWTTFTTNNSGLESNDIISVAVDHNDVVWFGAGDAHVTSYDGTSWRTLYDSPTRIHNIVIDNNNVKWIASNMSGLARYDDGTMQIFTAENSPAISNVPLGLALDVDNSIWAGFYYDRGVARISENEWTVHPYFGNPPAYNLSGIAVDHNGVKWMAGSDSDHGVWSYDEANGVTYYDPENLVTAKVWDVAVDYENTVWFAEDGGVSSFDGNIWRHYTTENSGLANNTVIGVTVDTNNAKWFATFNGVSRFNYQTGPYILLTSPNGGEILKAMTKKDITWASQELTQVRIDYSINEGMTWIPVVDNIDASALIYSWTLPEIKSDSCLVRITDSKNPEIADISNAVFTISPPFVKVTSPNGDEKWAGGKPHKITWNAIGVWSVRLDYSIDNGESWVMITENIDAETGKHLWDVPDIEASGCFVRITDMNDAGKTDESDSPFALSSPWIELISPNGGELWMTNEYGNITWLSDGVDNIRIEYSVDGGLSWNLVESDCNALTGTYIWDPFDVESMLCMVKLTDNDNKSLFDTSDDVFNIVYITSIETDAPTGFAIQQNAPNPFNAETTIAFSLPESEHVSLMVYAMNGQLIDTLVDSELSAGHHAVHWNGDLISTGLYFAILRAGGLTRTTKMLLIK